MQTLFDLGEGARIAAIRDRLAVAFGRARVGSRRDPMGQLVKSLISSRTKDRDSQSAFDRLRRRFPRWKDIAVAGPGVIAVALDGVTYLEDKAHRLCQTVAIVERAHPDFDLEFLGEYTVEQALAWLERLPGVGRKVAASTLNFSTLRLPALVIDTHVLRVLERMGFTSPNADARRTYDTVMPALDGWSADDLAELHVLIKRLGQTFCRFRAPNCSECPVAGSCRRGGADRI